MKSIFVGISQTNNTQQVVSGDDSFRQLKMISLAPYVVSYGIENCEVHNFSYDEEPEYIASRLQGDIYLFSCYIWNIDEILEVSKILKNREPQSFIVLGGPQVSPVADEILDRYAWVDIVVKTEKAGNTIARSIIETLNNGAKLYDIPGIVYRNKEDIIRTPDPDCQVDMVSVYKNDIIPCNGDEYIATVETYRGCPFDCGYCFWGKGEKVQYYDMEKVKQDLNYVYNHPKVKEVEFADADFFMNYTRCLKIIDYISNLKPKASTYFELNIKNLTRNMITAVSKIPKIQFVVSPQTVNESSLYMMSRNRGTPFDFRMKVNMIRDVISSANITTAIILGAPGETYESYLDTLDFCLSLKPNKINIGYPLYLLPGSRFFEDRKTLGFTYTAGEVCAVTSTPTMSRSTMTRCAHLSCYVQLLTIYYPEIREYLYEMQPVNYINELNRWAIQIEREMKLLPIAGNIPDYILSSVYCWNKWKRLFFERGTENPERIYEIVGLKSAYPYTIFKKR